MKRRIDYWPSRQAEAAIDDVCRSLPRLSQHACLDWLVLNGLWVLRNGPPPVMTGRDRQRWLMPQPWRVNPED